MPADRQQGSGRAGGGSGRAGRQGELPTGLNLVVVTGQLGRPAEQRELPSGDRMVSYQVTVPRQASGPRRCRWCGWLHRPVPPITMSAPGYSSWAG